ncbi:hypothetical protein CCP2SC5_2120001 [Azospirillaceae bacterium]
MVMASGGDEPVMDGEVNSPFARVLNKRLNEVNKPTLGSALYRKVRADVVAEVPQTPQYGAIPTAGYDDGADFLIQHVGVKTGAVIGNSRVTVADASTLGAFTNTVTVTNAESIIGSASDDIVSFYMNSPTAEYKNIPYLPVERDALSLSGSAYLGVKTLGDFADNAVAPFVESTADDFEIQEINLENDADIMILTTIKENQPSFDARNVAAYNRPWRKDFECFSSVAAWRRTWFRDEDRRNIA